MIGFLVSRPLSPDRFQYNSPPRSEKRVRLSAL
jgi:hypothetical protein